jgi:hypothetical protein
MLSSRGRKMNYARRQQHRRLARAVAAVTASVATSMLALAFASAGAESTAGIVFLLALSLGLYARHWLSLAERSAVGARSEDEVQRVLAPLEGDGWRLRHSLRWRGHGDIDSLAIAPSGVAFAIETKTKAYDDRHLARVQAQARWLSRRRRRWCRRGALPVLCVVRPRHVERVERQVLVVSVDQLTLALRQVAGDSRR